MADATAATGHGTTGRDTTGELLDLLAEHVPLALLADLTATSAPDSTEILRSEGLPDDAWWESAGPAPVPPRDQTA